MDYQDTSIMYSVSTPATFRYIIPLLILASMITFLHANLNVGTVIYGTIKISTFEKKMHVFDFSMWKSIQDFWDAGTYLLSILIAVWSGIWPYIKCTLLLGCWILPPRILPVSKRRLIIWIVSFLAKWSMLDIFFLIIFDVAFRFHIDFLTVLPPKIRHLLPDDFATFDLTVDPALVSFTFITASIVVIACISVVEAYHRNAVAYAVPRDKDLPTYRDNESPPRRNRSYCARLKCPRRSWFEHATEELEYYEYIRDSQQQQHQQQQMDDVYQVRLLPTHEDSDEVFLDEAKKISFGKESILGHVFDHPGSFSFCYSPVSSSSSTITHSLGYVIKPIAKFLLIFSLFFAIATIHIGSTVDSFSFRFLELAGEALNFLQEGSDRRKYSLLQLMDDLSTKAFTLHGESMSTALKFGVSYLQVLFIWFALAWPYTQITVMLFLFLCPLTLRDQKIIFYLLTICASMASLEVFSVAVIVSLSNLEKFSVFLQEGNCDFLLDRGIECFRVRTELLPGCFMLFLSAFFILFLSFVMFRVCERVIMEREKRALTALLRAKGIDGREADSRVNGLVRDL
jgi:hypothetical protein